MTDEGNFISKETLESIEVSNGKTLLTLSEEKPVLLVFLRHFGCIFCRQALKDISTKLSSFQKNQIEMVFVHLSDDSTAKEYFNEYGFPNALSISDPETTIYKKFGLIKGGFRQLYGLSVWAKGISAMVNEGTSFSAKQIGDSLQMPGIFVISKGKIIDSFIHRRISDRPDYNKFLKCCEV